MVEDNIMELRDTVELANEFEKQERDEVDSVEIVSTIAAHITNATYNNPVTEEISSTSPDQVTG